MTQTNAQPAIFYADQEHDALRFTLPVLMLVAFVVGYMLMNLLLSFYYTDGGRPDAAILWACGGAIPLGLGLALLGERILKRVWRSGRRLAVADGRLTLVRRNEPDVTITIHEPYHLTKWSFQMGDYPRGGRERHIAGNWFCLGCQVQQEEDRINFFVFVPPGQKATLDETHDFHPIDPTDVYDTSFFNRTFRLPERPKLPTRVISGKDGRYWLAERNRWAVGVELTRNDFVQVMQILDIG